MHLHYVGPIMRVVDPYFWVYVTRSGKISRMSHIEIEILTDAESTQSNRRGIGMAAFTLKRC